VRSLPGRLYSLTRLSSFRAMTLIPSCLISRTTGSPEGAVGAAVERQGGMNPVGRLRGRNNNMRRAVAARADHVNLAERALRGIDAQMVSREHRCR
jgi:hypothetical protein